MADAENKAETKDASKRDRSPKFPYIGLGKAVDRIEVLYSKVKRYEARVADIAKDWGLSPKSSSTDRTVAALQSFGLIEDSGSGDNRKIKLSELGARIIADQRPGIRDTLLAEAALKPPIISEYARRWGGGRPDDAHALSQLQFEGKFSEEGARMFLRVFDETIRYAISGKPDSKAVETADRDREDTRAKVGDLVQWTSNGVDQFKEPLPVVAVSDDGQWLWVVESQTAIPMGEIQIVQVFTPPPPPPPPPPELGIAGARSIFTATKPGMQRDTFSLDEGAVTIEFPEGLKKESVDDLEEFLKLFIKKARRRAGGATQ